MHHTSFYLSVTSPPAADGDAEPAPAVHCLHIIGAPSDVQLYEPFSREHNISEEEYVRIKAILNKVE
eukprot:m.273812 g.273812  ORF g.273812 m.273812 type:complete len:67 (+) comp26886_c6_seq4:255-455(+)